MSTHKQLLSLAVALAFGTSLALAESPGLGKPITEADITAWNIEVLPDGTGLPPGSGTVQQGRRSTRRSARCATARTASTRGPASSRWSVLPSSIKITTMKTVPYYKYATTLYDVMRRSMPFPLPKTLTNDELYALSAYILALNKIIREDEVMDPKTLPQVKMPNRDNFIVWDQDKIDYEPVHP